MVVVHPNHPDSLVQLQLSAEQTTASIDASDKCSVLGQRKSPTNGEAEAVSSGPVPCKKTSGVNTIPAQFRSNTNIANTVFTWLCCDGIPYHATTTAAFRNMVVGLTGNVGLKMMSREKYNGLLEGEFMLFTKSVRDLLTHESELVLNEPFLNLIHDCWANFSKCGVIGASVAFIDSRWEWRHIALLATAKNDVHTSNEIASLIRQRCSDVYHIDVVALAKFTVSDTAIAARKVSEYFEHTQQADCNMHVLNLCIGYGVDLRDNMRSKQVFDAVTGMMKKEVCTVTEGGALDKGREAIVKPRALNKFFNSKSPTRAETLTRIQEALGLPQRRAKMDVDVRVASACKLMRRSLLNYYAFKRYFASDTSSKVFAAISEEEWSFIAEMEAITYYLSKLALVEMQQEMMVASFMLVFRKLAEAKLEAEQYRCYDFSMPVGATGDKMLPRALKKVSGFSKDDMRCITRMLAQVRERFPPLDADAVMTLMLELRTKNCVSSIIGNMGRSDKDTDILVRQATERLKAEHMRLLKISQTTQHDCNSPPQSVVTE